MNSITKENESAEITFHPPENEKHGVGLLICNYAPFNVGKPFMFRNYQLMENFLKKHNLLDSCIIIEGYNILIAWAGQNKEMFPSLPLGNRVSSEILVDLNKMAKFYEATKIKGREGYLKRYKRD